MRCPVDETTLVMSERSGIEIDYCPQCRGVWLDRGELDKIIDRSVEVDQPAPPQRQQQPQYDSYRAPQPPHHHQQQQQQGRYPKKRKESWLSELFD